MSGVLTAARRGRPDAAARLAAAAARDVLRAEWTKLRTMPGTLWLGAAASLVTIAVSAATLASSRCQAGAACTADITRLSLTGVEAGQAMVAVLAVLMIGGEYGTGMIRATFAAMPRRWQVLAAKAAVLTGPVLAAAVIAVAGSLLAGLLILPGHGFTAARGFTLISLAHAATARAAAGSVLYLALIGLLSLAIATIVRDSAAATGAVLGVLYVPPMVVLLLGGHPVWQRRIERYSPVNAGLAIEDTTGFRHLPIGPWAGLGVLALWTAAALLAAAVTLRLRDS